MLEDHLGGSLGRTHLDHGALDWLIDQFAPTSYLDIGCGPGGMAELAESKGLQVQGIDGDHTLERYNPDRFLIHDFTKGPVTLEQQYDIGWSCEFVEHVYEEYIPNFMSAFKQCKVLMITYAPPGWPGHHHVNCQPEQYWIDCLQDNGFTYSSDLTGELRAHSTMNTHKKKKAFVRNRGLMFVNE
jgi:SAM-dependent methyltransferase